MVVDPDSGAVEDVAAETVETLGGAVAGVETDADADDGAAPVRGAPTSSSWFEWLTPR